jgi:putative DNA primase/helicase
MVAAPEKQTATPTRFDSKMFQASLAFCGLQGNWNRAFKRILLTDKETGLPIIDEKTGKQKTTLRSCNAPQESASGNAVWLQVNEPFVGSATSTNKYGTTYPKKAGNHEIHFIRNVTLDTEYPPNPDAAIAIGRKLVDYLIAIGLVEADHPIEHSGAGPHVVIPIMPIETTPETAKLWNEAIAKVVKTHIKPEFERMCKEAGIGMDLGGFDISRVLSPPGTWRPRNPDKDDCEALHQGVLRRWLEPYTDGNHPVRKESTKLTQLIRDTFDQISDPTQWLYDYAATHSSSDRSAFFQTLVNATYLKFGENAVQQTKELINSLSGEKYNGRLDQELERSLEVAMRTHRQNLHSSNGHHQDPIDSLIKEIQQNIQGIWTKPRSDRKREFVPHKVELEKIIEYLEMNEYGDGKLFAEAFNGLVCYDHSEKSWYVWREHHWKKDTIGKIKQLVSGYLGSIYLKARGDIHNQMVDIQLEIEQLQKESGTESKITNLKGKLGRLEVLMGELEKRAKSLRAAKRMNNVLTFAMSEHNIGITGEVWDSDPWLLGVKNGVVDLRTGECRDGYPIDYIRSVSPTEWTGLNTHCPRFEKFLQEIFEVLPEAQLLKLTNDKYNELSKEEQEHVTQEHREKLISFLQRLFGYSLAGLSTEAIFPLLYGEEGRNGKDTLFKVLKFVLGLAIADAISNDVFLSADRGRSAGAATPHLADLQGKRMVWGSETKQGDRINVSQIKQLTGGGDISARKNYGDQYTFAPTHTLFLMTNYKPHADAKDKAFWSRACLIEFVLRFVDNPQAENERKADTNLTEDLKAEASGILAWLVRGCLSHQQQGLNRPEIVLLSTESYRASEDNIQHFINDCCVCNDKARVGAQELYDAYVAWCDNNNIKNKMNGRLFGEDMSKRFEKVHKRTRWEYQKIGIRTDDTPPENDKGDGLNLFSDPCDGSKEHPSQSSKTASEEALDTIERTIGDGCDGLIQEVPYSTPREDETSTLLVSTRHTRHTSELEDGLKQPLEPCEGTVMGKNAPVTYPSHSLEDFWSVGKKHNYPEITDLDLKAGMTGWNTFRLRHGLLIPDVIARLGGM